MLSIQCPKISTQISDSYRRALSLAWRTSSSFSPTQSSDCWIVLHHPRFRLDLSAMGLWSLSRSRGTAVCLIHIWTCALCTPRLPSSTLSILRCWILLNSLMRSLLGLHIILRILLAGGMLLSPVVIYRLSWWLERASSLLPFGLRHHPFDHRFFKNMLNWCTFPPLKSHRNGTRRKRGSCAQR